MEFISSTILIKNSQFSNLDFRYELFDSAYCQIITKITSIYDVASDVSFLISLLDSTNYLENFTYANCSNGLFDVKNSNISIISSIFNNSLQIDVYFPFSLISVSKNSDFIIINFQNSSFSGFLTLTNGSIISSFEVVGLISIINCEFARNRAKNYGGSLYFYLTGNVSIESCIFLGNEAENGGGMAYDNDKWKNQTLCLKLYNNTFDSNSAQFSGGAMMFSYVIPFNFTNIDATIYKNNTASLYGDNYASAPYRMILLSDRQIEKSYNLDNLSDPLFRTFRITSGSGSLILLRFVFVDYFYQTVKRTFVEYFNFFIFKNKNNFSFLRNPILEIHKDLTDDIASDAEIRGKVIGSIQDGVLEFSNLSIYGHAFKTYNLRIYPSFLQQNRPFLDLVSKNEIVKNERYSYYFPLMIEDCSFGQIEQKLSDSEIYYCSLCPVGTYSLNKDGNCLACPEGGNCSLGILNVMDGYWRIGDNILPCLPNPLSCL